MSQGEDGPAAGVIRVLVVDDHPIWLDAVARDLEASGLVVCGPAREVNQAVRVATATRTKVGDVHWLRTHGGAIQIVLLGIALIWVLFATLTFAKLVLAAIILGALELALWRIREGRPAPV